MDSQQSQNYSQRQLVKVGDMNDEFSRKVTDNLMREIAKMDIKRFEANFNKFFLNLSLLFRDTELNKNLYEVKDKTLYVSVHAFHAARSVYNRYISFINHKAQDPIVCFDLIQSNESISCVIHFPKECAIRLGNSTLSSNCFSKHLKLEDQAQSQIKFIEFCHSMINYLKTITYNCEDIEGGTRFYIINLDPALPKDRIFEIESRSVNGVILRSIISYSLMLEYKTFEEYRNSLVFRNVRGTTAKIQKASERTSTQVSTADNFVSETSDIQMQIHDRMAATKRTAMDDNALDINKRMKTTTDDLTPENTLQNAVQSEFEELKDYWHRVTHNQNIQVAEQYTIMQENLNPQVVNQEVDLVDLTEDYKTIVTGETRNIVEQHIIDEISKWLRQGINSEGSSRDSVEDSSSSVSLTSINPTNGSTINTQNNPQEVFFPSSPILMTSVNRFRMTQDEFNRSYSFP